MYILRLEEFDSTNIISLECRIDYYGNNVFIMYNSNNLYHYKINFETKTFTKTLIINNLNMKEDTIHVNLPIINVILEDNTLYTYNFIEESEISIVKDELDTRNIVLNNGNAIL